MSDRHEVSRKSRDREDGRERERGKAGHRDRDQDRHRDRDREKHRERDRDRHRERDKDSDRHRHRDRHVSREGNSHRRKAAGRNDEKDDIRNDVSAKDKASAKRSRSPEPVLVEPDEAEKKRQRLAKLAAWKSKKPDPVVEASDQEVGGQWVESGVQEDAEARPHSSNSQHDHIARTKGASRAHDEDQEQEAWLPWEDPTALFTSSVPTGELSGPAPSVPPPKPLLYEPHEGEDPLDAFMAAEVAPEVKAKEHEEAKKKEEARLERAKLMAEGKVPKLEKILVEESDEEETPDQEIQIPEHKVKLVVGPGGDKIKYIQRKSKCRLQIKKSEEELNKGFLEKTSYAIPKPRKLGDEVKTVTMMLFGNAKECEIATRMIDEAIENREQKQKQREKEYEKKREQKNRDRQMYHLRHTHDYEALGIPIGASKADARQAYRQLAKKYHPDKHPDNKEEMKAKFQAIQKAFDSLMSTDEDARIEALGHR